MDEEQICLEKIVFNENAYFYCMKKQPDFADFFNDIEKKSEKKLLRIDSKKIKDYNYSLLVVRKKTSPSFLLERIDEWDEIKIAYFLCLLKSNIAMIVKKNISFNKNITDCLQPIDYSVLSNLYVSNDSKFEKISMQNLDVSDSAIKNKVIEAYDLSQSISTYGISNYYLSSYRMRLDDDYYSLALHQSRINKVGEKEKLESLVDWADEVIGKINGKRRNKKSLVSYFAEPIGNFDLSKMNPSGLLLLLNPLKNWIEENEKDIVYRRFCNGKVKDRIINAFVLFESLSRIMPVDANGYAKRKNGSEEFIVLKNNAKRIEIQSTFLSHIIFDEKNLVEYINENNLFIVTFKDAKCRYSNGIMFQDSRLKQTKESFMEMFVGFDELANVDSEKGTFGGGKNQTEFSDKSIFHFVENEYQNKYDYFVCDDLGNEFADHIGVSDDKIAFFVEKYKTAGLSASSFHDVIAQAQKNLGSFNIENGQYKSKIKKLDAFYKFNKGNGKKKSKNKKKGKNASPNNETGISRIRTQGVCAKNVLQKWQKALTNPFLKKELYVVTNLLSKQDLSDALDNVCGACKKGDHLDEAKAIFWLISSLASCCKELGVDLRIVCRT